MKMQACLEIRQLFLKMRNVEKEQKASNTIWKVRPPKTFGVHGCYRAIFWRGEDKTRLGDGFFGK